jgi:hypothetical protein
MDVKTWGHGDMEMETWKHGDMETWRHEDMETSNGKRKPGQCFLNPFTVCSWCKRKFVICPFVDEETNKSYPFANELNGLYGPNGLNGLAHLCLFCLRERLIRWMVSG